MISTSTALNSLRPNCQYVIVDNSYDSIIWNSDNGMELPSYEEITLEINRLQEDYSSKQYQRDRKLAYPSIEDQLDLLYHQGYDGWKAEILEVKNQYPKPAVGIASTNVGVATT